MSFSHSILAVLARGPATPSTIRRQLETEIATLDRLNMGQVSQALIRLERDNYIIAHGELRATNGRSSTEWQITDDGRTELNQWWAHPVERSYQDRDELIIKIILAINSAEVSVLSIVDRQRSHVIKQLRQLNRHMREEPAFMSATQLQRERRIFELEAEMRWLDRVEELGL
ncbi:PadR family transcriptional regulator [Corynebacterium poyangense]|uniref:PadR family transcriptional regulator n=1 Tax=Corynebacterium poyangense TaxID=2684405 RepID=A0A7H0SMT7_9CORY|nr:helix-turn-helix transcriptional regulator [Corynebacterium poyangense]MBZ8176310.1 PadR family transcriptional regulator [Corynebacterium poyangense]QNQ89862.1 PadR family transcriptional regulator [Corynebacterium poyangense]